MRTRGLDIGVNAKRQAADAAMRAETNGVIDRWGKRANVEESPTDAILPHITYEMSLRRLPG